MKTEYYYTRCLRVGNFNKREWYVERYAFENELFHVHKKFNLVYLTKKEAEDSIDRMIELEGGTRINELPVIGTIKGTKRPKRNFQMPYYRGGRW